MLVSLTPRVAASAVKAPGVLQWHAAERERAYKKVPFKAFGNKLNAETH